MEFKKHFCRLVTEQNLDNDDVAEYYDIIQSIVSTKMVFAYTDDEMVEADVIIYTGKNNTYIYEIVLNDQINLDEGEEISDELAEAFEFDFEFETSIEI